MGDEFQECSGCKLVKHVNNFDGFKTCNWCREHSRCYREKNKDDINKKRREKTALNGALGKIGGPPINTQKYYSPYDKDTQNVPLVLGNPHLIAEERVQEFFQKNTKPT